MPSGPATGESSVTLPTIPPGALLGELRFPAKGSDRRGQDIAPGVYTLRYGNYPVNGNHQGVAPQRDFLVLVPAALDKSADPISDFDALMDLSRKASRTPHPAVLSFWKADSDQKQAGLEKQGRQGLGFCLTKIGRYHGLDHPVRRRPPVKKSRENRAHSPSPGARKARLV